MNLDEAKAEIDRRAATCIGVMQRYVAFEDRLMDEAYERNALLDRLPRNRHLAGGFDQLE